MPASPLPVDNLGLCVPVYLLAGALTGAGLSDQDGRKDGLSAIYPGLRRSVRPKAVPNALDHVHR